MFFSFKTWSLRIVTFLMLSHTEISSSEILSGSFPSTCDITDYHKMSRDRPLPISFITLAFSKQFSSHYITYCQRGIAPCGTKTLSLQCSYCQSLISCRIYKCHSLQPATDRTLPKQLTCQRRNLLTSLAPLLLFDRKLHFFGSHRLWWTFSLDLLLPGTNIFLG